MLSGEERVLSDSTDDAIAPASICVKAVQVFFQVHDFMNPEVYHCIVLRSHLQDMCLQGLLHIRYF